MIAYSKMRAGGTNSKSRSMDFSDLLVFPEEPNSGKGSNLKLKAPEASHMKSMLHSSNKISSSREEGSCSEQENDDESNRRVFCRSSSTAASSRFFKQKNMGIESAVKRAFSMRRSSSVSERYCRIHDQSVTLTSEMDWEEDVERAPNRSPTTSGEKKKKKKKKKQQYKKGGKILVACRRFLGL